MGPWRFASLVSGGKLIADVRSLAVRVAAAAWAFDRPDFNDLSRLVSHANKARADGLADLIELATDGADFASSEYY